MVSPSPRTAILRYLLPNGLASLEFYPLPLIGEVRLGRDPSCQVVLDSELHTGVSRHHAKIVSTDAFPYRWEICDLDSSNGTYVNGERLHGQRILQEGDRIGLGKQGPRFLFETLSLALPDSTLRDPSVSPMQGQLGGGKAFSSLPGITHEGWYTTSSPSTPPSNSVTFSQLFPIVSTGRDLTRKAYLIPGIVTVSFVVLMFIAVGNPALFNFTVAAYLSSAAYYFVYQLCGKHKPWWLLTSSALITVLLMVSPVLRLFLIVFRGILPGAIPDNAESINVLVLMIQMFFGAGLMEELLKAVPILLAALVGVLWRSPRRREFGVCEPLDGILIGTASAVGFTLVETLGQYVPTVINNVNFHASGVPGDLLGLQLLIPRILGSVSGHMAYSGYFGYFIGLSVLKPKHRWRILLIGYLTAALLHALWNTTGYINPIVLALVGVLSYAFLAAAILKARALSPTRSQNFATRFTRPR